MSVSQNFSGAFSVQYSYLSNLTLVTDAGGIITTHTPGSFTPSGEIPDDWKFNQHTLTRLRLGQGITYIGKNAFDGCNGLQDDLLIPSGVTEIDVEAFQGCHGLTGTL